MKNEKKVSSSFWCFISPSSDPKKLQKEIELIYLFVDVVRNLKKKNPYTKMEFNDENKKHKLCMKRHFVFTAFVKIFSWNQFHEKN